MYTLMNNQLVYNYDIKKHYELKQNVEFYKKKGLSGLMNLGNKCFLNSIVQALSHTLALTDYITTTDYRADINKNKQDDTFILAGYVSLLNHLWDTNQIVQPKTFVENMSVKHRKYYNISQQQDAHECFVYILESLHNALSYNVSIEYSGAPSELVKMSIKHWETSYKNGYSKIIELFGGTEYTNTVCVNCKHTTDTFEQTNNVSLSIEGCNDVYDALNKYYNDEIINNYNCEKCQYNMCKKTTRGWNFPTYFVLHFKRFGNDGSKLTQRIDFPLDDLDITKYMSIPKMDKNNYIYGLYAVVNHTGDTNSGHYYVCCKNLDTKWYLMDDANVSTYSENSIVSSDSYMLFYYRKFIKPPVKA